VYPFVRNSYGGALLADHNINVNINDKSNKSPTGAIGRATRSSTSDPLEVRALSNQFKNLIQRLEQKSATSTSAKLEALLRELINKSGASGVSNDQISSLAKSVAREAAKSAIQSISSSASKSTGGVSSDTDVGKAINKGLDKAADSMVKTMQRELSKLNITVDVKELKTGVSGTMRSLIPKSTEVAIKELTTSVNSMKNLLRDIATVGKRIGSMRQSGGGVDIQEISSVVAGVKKLGSDLSDLSKQVNSATASVVELAKESKVGVANIKKTIGGLKEAATSRVTTIRSSAKGDPAFAVKDLLGKFTELIKSSESVRRAIEKSDVSGELKDLYKFMSSGKAEGSIAELKDISKHMIDLKNAIKSGVLAKEISIPDLDKFMQKLSTLLGSVEQVTKGHGSTKVGAKTSTFIKEVNKVVKDMSEFSSNLKLIVDDKEIKQVLSKGYEAPVSLKPANIKGFIDDITNAVKKMKKPGVDVSAEVNELNMAVDSNQVKGALKKIVRKLDIDIDVSAGSDLSKLTKQINDIANKKVRLTFELDADTTKLDAAAKKVTQDLNREFEKASLSRRLYSPSVIEPRTAPPDSSFQAGAGLKDEAKKIYTDTRKNFQRIGNSLAKLQEALIRDLEKGFKTEGNKWSVVRDKDKAPSQSFKLQPGGRQWVLEIANIDKLKKMFNDFDSSAQKLVGDFENKVISDLKQANSDPTQMAEKIGQWLKTVSNKELQGREDINPTVRRELISLKQKSKGAMLSVEEKEGVVKSLGIENIKSLFESTYAASIAKRRLQSEGIVKKLAIPAVHVDRKGSAYIQTTHGSHRAMPKFGTFQSGFEITREKLMETGKARSAKDFEARIKKAGIRPDRLQGETLSMDMLSALYQGHKDPAKFMKLYDKGVARKRKEIDAFATGPEARKDLQKELTFAVNKAKDSFNSLADNQKTFEAFANLMKEANVTAYDVIRSLDKIKVENTYDIMRDVLTSGKNSPVSQLIKAPQYDRSVRDFETAIGEVEGLLPLLEIDKPRRGYHQENVVNLMTRKGAFYDKHDDRLQPAQQKQLVKDLNFAIRETVRFNEKSNYDGVERVSTLGIPESPAGTIEEYRKNLGTTQTKFLKNLNATLVKMYSEDLPSLAPFQQFQHTGRNISNVSGALWSEKGELPKLRSERERAVIEAGRYGDSSKGGYGYNVVAELRNTSSTFEDQILISGKLAKALTHATKNLVKPGPAGRVSKGSGAVEEYIKGTGVDDLKPQKLVDPKEIENVSREYMKILGVSQEYEGRADKALIEAVEKTVAVVRGEKVEVQQARLAETFMNYFGRKLTTRYGSKGVSVSPTKRFKGADMALEDLLKNYGKGGVKIDAGANLGYQIAPKSVGKLASELFGKDVSDDLKQKLVASGNKFMIELFHDVEGSIVSMDEGKKTRELYESFTKEWQKIFKTSDAPELGTSGIEAIRKIHSQKMGAGLPGAGYDIKPIEVRISSYGAGKRGLQTEFLESIMSNVAGTGAGGVTTLKKLSQDQYEKLLSGGMLSSYSKSLGFKGLGKSEEELAKEFYKKWGGKASTLSEAKEDDETAVLAKRAAALEAASNYYSEIVDEFGKRRKGLIGEKFLTIIEEPHENKEWTKGQIASGQKGARLNIPAFSAYASVFGESSAIMKELSESKPYQTEKGLDIDTKKHWEYIKALQTLQGKSSDFYEELTSNLDTVDVSLLKTFDKATGVKGQGLIPNEVGQMVPNPRSFDDTILDLSKYPAPFKVNIPTGRTDPEGKKIMEEFYVPGAAGRVTYPEPLIAGEEGMDSITRRLTHVINMAKELNDLLDNPEESMGEFAVPRLKKIIGSWTKEGSEASVISKRTRRDDPAVVSNLESKVDSLFKVLSTNFKPDPNLIPTDMTEADYGVDFYSRQMRAVEQGSKTKTQALSTILNTFADMVIGKRTIEKEGQRNASTVLSRSQNSGTVLAVAQEMGINLADDTIKRKIEALQKAKIEYYNDLAKAALGKTGAVNELFFSKKIPAVMGKAVVATTDRTDELRAFGKKLREVGLDAGINFTSELRELDSVFDSHRKDISNLKKVGMPVLKQDEVGLTKEFASKIPVEFFKKYEMDKEEDELKLIKKTKTKGSLKDLINYSDMLRSQMKGMSEKDRDALEEHIEKDVVPYVESIRFPFTGTSSLAPYKPKLLRGKYKDEEGRDLASQALMVPGIPSGMEGIYKIVEDVDKQIDNLVRKREDLHESGGTEGEISKLTETIRELEAAIDSVIPKYTSQAQKLDFDGDTIEIHAAKTIAARKDIEAHYKRFTGGMSDGDRTPLTLDAYRSYFLSDATVVPNSSNAVLAESLKASEKKFPHSKGFDFLKRPFYTEDLEYLDSKEALKILGSDKGAGDLKFMVSNILEESGMAKDTEGVGKLIADIEKKKSENLEEYANNIIDLIETDTHSKFAEALKSGIKRKLSESKFGDAVEAQLFKINTGSETEALYRIHRVAESMSGFGGGEIRSGGREATDYFKKRFPETFAFTPEDMIEEFNTLMNETLRFSIQKGMDVKHAGGETVAGELTSYLSKGPSGASDLWKTIIDENNSDYKQLRSLRDTNEKSLNRKLGEFSTDELFDTAEGLMTARGQDTTSLAGMDRDALKKVIIDRVGLKGFLTELSIMIYKEAVDGLIQQAKEWSPEKKAKPGYGLDAVGDDIEGWAELQIKKQMAGDGINIAQTIGAAKRPMYGMRTSTSKNPYKQYQRYSERLGELPIDQSEISALPTDVKEEYEKKYKYAKATALNIQRDIMAFDESEAGGAYAEMLRDSIATLKKESEAVNRFGKVARESGYDYDEVNKIDLADRALDKSMLPKYQDDVLRKPSDTDKLVRGMSDVVGLPMLSDTELNDIESKTKGKIASELRSIFPKMSDDELQKETDSHVARAQAITQFDRINKVAMARERELAIVSKLAPRTTKVSDSISTTMPDRSEFYKTQREKAKASRPTASDYGTEQFLNREGVGGGSPKAPGYVMGGGAGGPVPVYIVGAAPSTTINVNVLNSAGIIGPATTRTKAPSMYDISSLIAERDMPFKDEYDAMGETLKKIKGIKGPGPFATTRERFSPTSLAGGDSDKIIKNLVESAVPDSYLQSIFDIGSLVGEKIERNIKRKGGGKIGTEVYMEKAFDEAGVLAGFADIVEYSDKERKTPVKVADIKTASEREIKSLKTATDKYGTTDINTIIDNIGDPANQELKGVVDLLRKYRSQVNAYLNISDTERGEVLFYDRAKKGETTEPDLVLTLKKDVELLNKDLDALKKARKTVMATDPEGFRKTMSKEQAEGKTSEEVSDEELDKAIEIALNRYERNKTFNVNKKIKDFRERYREEEGPNVREGFDRVKEAMRARGRKSALDRFSPDELTKFLVPSAPVEGQGAEANIKNLRMLHNQAKLFQKSKGIDKMALEELPSALGNILKDIPQKGYKGSTQEFIKAMDTLKEHDKISGMEIIKAWKLWRMATGDWLIGQAEAAKEQMELAREAGDINGEMEAYGDFLKSTDKAKEFVRRGLGKRTDIYTEGKRFMYPELAQAADVYLSPEQIMKSAGEPLGDDEKLIEAFKKITTGISSEMMTAPSAMFEELFVDLSNMNKELVDTINQAERFSALGEKLDQAWDVDILTKRVTRLRAALQQVLRNNKEMNAEQVKNVENIVKHLKKLENMYSSMDTSSKGSGYGEIGVIPVSKDLSPRSSEGCPQKKYCCG
jgi:hypothetical protein